MGKNIIDPNSAVLNFLSSAKPPASESTPIKKETATASMKETAKKPAPAKKVTATATTGDIKRKEIKSHRLQLVLTETTFNGLKQYCKDNGLTVNYFVNELIKNKIGE